MGPRVGVNPKVILRRRSKRLLATFDILVGMGLHPRVVGGGMVRHEIEQQLDVAPRQFFAELRQRLLTAQDVTDSIGGDRKAGATDSSSVGSGRIV